MHYWQSPTVIIDRYTGELHNQLHPEWLRTVQTECRFWQNRTLMLDMMGYFASNIADNFSVSRRALSWCSAMSVSIILFDQGYCQLIRKLKIPLTDFLPWAQQEKVWRQMIDVEVRDWL